MVRVRSFNELRDARHGDTMATELFGEPNQLLRYAQTERYGVRPRLDSRRYRRRTSDLVTRYRATLQLRFRIRSGHFSYSGAAQAVTGGKEASFRRDWIGKSEEANRFLNLHVDRFKPAPHRI